MNRHIIYAALIALLGCDNELPIDIYETVEVPVALVFPSEEMRDRVEEGFFERVEDANELYANSGVTLVVTEVRVEDYSPHFDARFDMGTMLDKTEIGGPLALYAVDTLVGYDGAGYGGYAESSRENPCHKVNVFLDTVLTGDEGPLIVAHEVGHQFSLDHSPDPNNFMNADVQGTEITEDQEYELLINANYYRQICMGLDR